MQTEQQQHGSGGGGGGQPSSSSEGATIPLYDMFLDIPHPLSSKSCPGPFIIDSRNNLDIFQELNKNIIQIVRFAFPEYDEKAPITTSSVNNNNYKHDDMMNLMKQSILNQYDVYAIQNNKVSFSSFTFSLQLSSGIRVHGHVRRYLPLSLSSRTRYDIGRRGERALIVLTRNTGADSLYKSILKTVEAISSQQMAMPQHRMPHKGEPQKWFLYQLTRYQLHLAGMYGKQPGMERGKPTIAAIPCVELGDEYHAIYKDVDTTKFIIPISLLQQNISTPSSSSITNHTYSSSIVPLLRCVGVVHAIRIMSALLSERRIIFVSSSPTRLATCSSAALAMLSCGLFYWQHLYIPVLPPHLWQYLAAPYPYLIGVLSSAVPKLAYTDGLGEVLIIHLDTNQLETRGIEEHNILQRLPDLFRTGVIPTINAVSPESIQQQIQGAASSASEQLAQDLFEVLKADKRILHGITTSTNYAVTVVGETATKATMAVKNTFLKLRDKGRQYLAQRSNTNDSGSNDADDEGGATATTVSDGPPTPENSMASDYIYTEGCHNEVTEEETRIAFTSFFLCLIGDMRWYLSTSPAPPGQPPSLPVLDRNKFLQSKRNMGEGEGTQVFQLLTCFCQTQMLEEFAKARIEEIRTKQSIEHDSPLFLQCAEYHRQHHIDFGILNVKRIVRQIVENNPSNGSRIAGILQTNARRIAMSLTSSKGYEGSGDTNQVIADLVESCHECTSILFDVMSVIWFRLRDCKGMNWKHGLQALQILRNLLYHGPLAAITEAVDGLDKIRALKYYENMRPVSVTQIRTLASVVYNLLVDRAKLFHVRRSCIERRRQLKYPQVEAKRERDPNARIGIPFINLHAAMNPNSSHGTVVNIPPKTAGPPVPSPASPPARATVDFLSTPPAATPGIQSQPSSTGATSNNANNNLVDFFDAMTVSTKPTENTGSAAAVIASNDPFNVFSTPVTVSPLPQTSNPMVQQPNTSAYNPLPVPQYNQSPTYAAIPPATNQSSGNRSPVPPSSTVVVPQQQYQQQSSGNRSPVPGSRPLQQQQWQQSPAMPSLQPQQPWQQHQAPFQQMPPPPPQQQHQFPMQGQPVPYQANVGVAGGYMPQHQQPITQQGVYPPTHQQYASLQQQQQQQFHQQQSPAPQPHRSVASQFDPFAKR